MSHHDKDKDTMSGKHRPEDRGMTGETDWHSDQGTGAGPGGEPGRPGETGATGGWPSDNVAGTSVGSGMGGTGAGVGGGLGGAGGSGTDMTATSDATDDPTLRRPCHRRRRRPSHPCR